MVFPRPHVDGEIVDHNWANDLEQRAANFGGGNKRITADSVSAINASAALTISTPDASGQVVEPAVACIPGGWNGHIYWALVTGYTGGDNQKENPSLYYSDDGVTFTPQPGVAFPIVGAPSGGYNDDPEILLGPDGKLHLFWLQSITAGTANMSIYWCTYDGTTLTTPTVILGPFNKLVEAPIAMVLYWDGANNQWVMFYTDIANEFTSTNAAYPYRRRTCPGLQPNGTWSSSTVCTVSNLPAGQTLWESHIAWYGNQLHMVSTVVPYMNNGTITNLYFGVSNDAGLTWTMSTNPLLRASASGWDNGTMYRGDIVRLEDNTGTIYGLWYSAASGTTWKMGYTTVKLIQPPAFTAGGNVIAAVPANALATGLAARASPIAPYVFGDSCIRANSAVSPGTADSGQAWTVDAGTPGITSNSIYATTTANTKLHVAPAGIADGVFAAETAVAATGGSASQCLLFRFQDASNYLSLCNRLGAYTYQLVVAGVTTNYVLSAGTPTNGDVLCVRAQGQTVWLYINNILVAQFVSQASFTAVSALGLQIVGTTTATFRNITARPLVGGL